LANEETSENGQKLTDSKSIQVMLSLRMTTERVTILVESNLGEDGPLTVMDTLHQFMDAFEFLSAAIAQEQGGDKVRWRLESLSKNSPATAVGIAYSADPAIVVAPLVHRGKKRLSHAFSALAVGEVEPWMQEYMRIAKSMLKRNLNGVGRTVFDLGDDAPRAVLVEKSARQGLRAIEEFESKGEELDRSRSEYGSVDAYVAEARTYHGRPAIYVKERLSDKIIPCVLSDELAMLVGSTHSWQDTWTGKRVRVKGLIFYDRDGSVSRVSASGLTDVAAPQPELKSAQSIDILSGRSPSEHIDSIWGYSDD
jgi:hypothetical protein